MNTQKLPWDLDVRVRERNVQAGVLTEKDVEKHIKELPDASATTERMYFWAAPRRTAPVFFA